MNFPFIARTELPRRGGALAWVPRERMIDKIHEAWEANVSLKDRFHQRQYKVNQTALPPTLAFWLLRSCTDPQCNC